MLQVARLAPQQLGEARDLVAAFLHSRLNADGGFQNRAGDSDLYYTVFGLEGLVALQEPVPAEAVASYLRPFVDGGGLDFVHLACLARCWASVSRDLATVPTRKILTRLEAYRSADGGYAGRVGNWRGNRRCQVSAYSAPGRRTDSSQPTVTSAKTSRCDSERRRFRDDVPFQPPPAHHRAIVTCRERMAARSKLVTDRTEHRTEARRVSQALEPLQTSLTPADGLVRVLDAVVLTPPPPMGDGWHHDGFRRRVARQPVGHDGPRHHPESL